MARQGHESEFLAKLAGELSRLVAPSDSFLEFYKRTLPCSWALPSHILWMCQLADDIVSGRTPRVALSLPPGHAKSTTLTHRLPVYWAGLNPGGVCVVTGYSARFAESELSRPSREIARELGVVGRNATSMAEWSFSNRSRLVARGVGAPPTGVNPVGLLVCDDPVKNWQDAYSRTVRDTIWDWWAGGILQRFWPHTRALIIATRWHHDDLIGRIKERSPDGWRFVNLPALALEGDPLGREPGEALWPDAKPASFLLELRERMGIRPFEALFQGNPTPEDGAMFRIDRIEFVSHPPRSDGWRYARFWDLAASTSGDYTAGVLLAHRNGLSVICDVARGRWEPAQRDAMIESVARSDGYSVTQVFEVEGNSGGKAQVHALFRRLSGLPLSSARATQAKELRAQPVASQAGSGNVSMVQAAWNRDFLAELAHFPAGAHDDQVDALSGAYNWLTQGNEWYAS